MSGRLLTSIILLFCFCNSFAQEQGNMKLKIETGFDLGKPGVFLNIEPKIKSSESTVFGLRFGIVAYSGSNNVSTANTQTTGNNVDFEYTVSETSGNGIISFVPTFDYYLNESIFLDRHFFRPYLGLGIGYYILGTYLEVTQRDIANAMEEEVRGRISNQIGFLFRAGIELERLIIGLEYNFTPKADIDLPNGETIGTIDLSFVGLSLGFTIGLRKA